MTTEKIKRLLDFTPFIILVISAVMLVWTVSTTTYALTWRNIAGIIVLPIIALCFIRQHKFGVLVLGFILFLGFLSLLSYTPGLTNATLSMGFNNSSVNFWGQPIFLLWLSIHFILSGRHYIGILTKKYWKELVPKENINVVKQ